MDARPGLVGREADYASQVEHKGKSETMFCLGRPRLRNSALTQNVARCIKGGP